MQFWESRIINFVWSAKSFRSEMGKIITSWFFKQFVNPTFCSRKEKWKLWNASPKKTAESLETFCLKSKQKLKAVFFQEVFFSKKLSWTRKTQTGEDCRNVYIRRVKVFCPKCKTNDKFVVFSKKTFVLKQTPGLVKKCFCHSYQKNLVQNLTSSKSTESGLKPTEKTLTRF